MNTVISKEKLMSIVKDNRDKHRKVFLEAIEGYRKEAINLLEKMIEKLKKGKTVNQYINLPVPEDHTPEYDRVIKMIELDTRGEITLGEEEFAQYVMDDWRWKREWVGTVSNYTSSV
jgi:hypothetical protein